MTQEQERAGRRADALRGLVRERGLPDVLAAAERLREEGTGLSAVRLRRRYVRNEDLPDGGPGGPGLAAEDPAAGPVPAPDERRRPPSDAQPPLARLLVSQGVAMRFHLVALFAAQCQARPGLPWRNTIPLGRTGDAPLTWLDLVAVAARPGGETTQASGYTSNKLRQFRSALDLLARRGLADIGRPGTRNRYEGFGLLAEDGRSTAAGAAGYRVPLADEECVDVPAEFFTRGWVQVLTKSEIAAWMMWRALGNGPGSGFAVASWRERAGAFGLSRDVRDTGRALEAYGLIEVVRPKERRENGTWRGYDPAERLFSDKVRVLPHALARPAHEVVERVLRKTATLGRWSKPLG
ncbi:hypothetical protein [Streptomyces marincola]|uniref:hypothetical protein n=1 Tax=Streptomyces marincola TaxID=2878388 RepID=UPI001CF437D9|nr:hypothetical protein [Streptomyces marincola]UCM89342.1 hypothetical protein LC193_16080 [Streptomyces marincola]